MPISIADIARCAGTFGRIILPSRRRREARAEVSPPRFVAEIISAKGGRLELPPFGGHSIIGHAMPMRRCSHAPHQAGLSA